MKTIAILLTSGAEWIAKQQETLDVVTTLSLSKVRRIQMVPNPKGGAGLALMPIFMSGNVDDFELDVKHIVAISTPDPDFEKQYLQEVSGIQLI